MLNHLTMTTTSSSSTTSSAPPPTPSTQHTTSTTTTITTDTLTRLLHRLPPTLSFPTRHRLSPRATTTTTTTTPLQTISFSSNNNACSLFEVGYFQLNYVDHLITRQLAESAELEALSLFDTCIDRRHCLFANKDWPLGYDDDEDHTSSFCLDTNSCSSLTSLCEFTRELEKVGLHVMDKLACIMGFENPFKENGSGSVGSSSLMWVSLLEAEKMSKTYPYVIGLHYQVRAQKWSLVSDSSSGSSSVVVEPEVGSVLVTFGDIAQVWSNEKLNKVRGRPSAILEDGAKSESRCISMTMLLTLPLESTVSPLVLRSRTITPLEKDTSSKERDHGHQNADCNEDNSEDWKVFNSFSFEDYAWKVYNERLHTKDPLDRYRKSRN